MTELKEKATTAFIWDMAGVLAKQGVGFLVSIFLARLLMPAEFGLVAMAMVFIFISQVVADFGLASALIQNKENTSLTYSSVFYLNVFMGIVLFALFWLLAPGIGDFYGNQEVGTLVRYLSFGFILTSLGQVQQTILRKQIEFRQIAIRATMSQVASGAVAIYLAYQGWGVYALVVQNLLGSTINTISLWQIGTWRPGLEFSWNEVKKLSGFSIYVFLSYVTNKLVTQLDTLIVGKVFSATTLGLYSRAASLNSLVTTFSSTSISKISFPLLSQLQDNREKFVAVYIRMLELVAFTSFCLSGALIFASADIITVLFGPNWTPSIFIFQILVLKSFTYPVSLLIVSVFWAGGKSKESFWYGNIAKLIALVPLVIAIGWGFNPFLYATVVAAIVNWGLTNWFVSRTFGISFLIQCKIIGIYLGMFLGIGIPIFLLARWPVMTFPFSGTTLGVMFAGVYLVLNVLMKTKGYGYSVEYLRPVVMKVFGKLG